MRTEGPAAVGEKSRDYGDADFRFDPASLQRVRWRTRRGLLELDIVLARFVDAQYSQLDDAGRRAFEALLDMPDNSLWDMIAGRRDAAPREQQALLKKIRDV